MTRRLIAGFAVLSLAASPAMADRANSELAYAPSRPFERSSPNAPATPPAAWRASTTLAEIQGLSCLGGGVFGSTLSFAYSEVILGAAAGGASLALVPVMAMTFAIGCSVGATAAPGLVWLYRSTL